MADSGTNPVRPNTFELEADVNVEFNEAASRQQINSGESVKTLFGKLRKFLTDLKAVAFSGAYSDLSGTPDLSRYASKSKYGDTTINVGRKADTTVGEYSTAEGSGTTASGNFSHTEGSGTTASGNGSHSEGGNSIASGSFSHAEGADTTASNYSSHAGGSVSEASGRYSFSHGNRTQALHESEVAFGQNNISNDDTLFSIGDGAYNARHNAFEITKTGGKLHDNDIATTDLIPTELPANGGNADTLSSKSIDYFMHWRNETIVNPDDVTDIGIYQWAFPTTNTIDPIAYGTLIVSNAFGYKCQIAIGVDTSVYIRHKTYDQEWSSWRNIADGGNADYATNAGNAEKLGGLDASAYSTSIIKSVTFSAATVDTGYIWTGIAFPKYVIGVDLEHFDVIVQFYKGNHADAGRAEWAMMFFSRDDVTTPLNGSFNGVIYYIDQR